MMLFINLLLWLGQMLAARDGGAVHLPHADLFTREQANAFLVAAMHAEAIKDPLQRCLAYPDPPGSHWDRDAVQAYCKYRHQPVISIEQVRHYIRTGRADELNRLLARALHEQLDDPAARAPLDRIFYADFDDASPSLRKLLDEWKRQTPHSAFAFAASGLAYQEAAFAARGSDYLSNTPKENIDAMDTLSALADTDLQKAISLDPKVMPAWSAMIDLGGFDKGYAYAESAARRGLAIQPDNYEIYSTLVWIEQPNWYGSLADMDRVTQEALKHAARNPTLKMLVPLKDFYRADQCHCDESIQLPAYVAALDGLAGIHQLKDAADTAFDVNDFPTAAIYFSELLRFNPGVTDAHLNRMYALADLGFTPWAVKEGDDLIAKAPGNEYAVKARGWAYLTAGDMPHARKDFERATKLAPTDMWAWSKLGGIYAATHQWDKAWSVANLLVRKDSKHADGWMLRADVQVWQPRPGLAATADYLALRYPDDKRIQLYVQFMRSVVKQRAANPGKSNAEILKAILIRQRAPGKAGVEVERRAQG
jgi:tetratricopeptide (TPR) repeat protein